jgi:putative acetyltransferase
VRRLGHLGGELGRLKHAVEPLPAAVRIVRVEANQPELMAVARRLFTEYAQALQAQGVDLCFQNFEQELAELPGEYAAPAGVLLLAYAGDQPAGCGAIRPLADVDYPNACEMKRLYVRASARRLGVGRLLARGLMDHASQVGFATLLLDTLDDMEAARSLYETLGFVEIPPYYFNPLPGAHYLKADLGDAVTRF